MPRITFADYFILLSALTLIIWSYLHYWKLGSQPALYAFIQMTNQPPQRITLAHSQRLSIQGRLGESVIEVKEGRIRFTTSPCHNKHCIHAGWLRTNGDFVACVPNQVSIELRGTSSAFDSISY